MAAPDGAAGFPEPTVVTFFKRAFDSYISSAGKYPLPMMWTF